VNFIHVFAAPKHYLKSVLKNLTPSFYPVTLMYYMKGDIFSTGMHFAQVLSYQVHALGHFTASERTLKIYLGHLQQPKIRIRLHHFCH